jgi:NAD/NADP transhydrogenase beta subunit
MSHRSYTEGPVAANIPAASRSVLNRRGKAADLGKQVGTTGLLDETLMLFGDAKSFVSNIVRELTGRTHP